MESNSAPCPSPTNSVLDAEWQRSIGNPSHAFSNPSLLTDFDDNGGLCGALDDYPQPLARWNSTEVRQNAVLHEALSPGLSETTCSDFEPSFPDAPYFNWGGSDTFLSPPSPAVRRGHFLDTRQRSISEPPGQLARGGDVFAEPQSQVTFHRDGHQLGEPRKPKLRATRSATREGFGQHHPRSESPRGRPIPGRGASTRFNTPPTSAPTQHYHPYFHSSFAQKRVAHRTFGSTAEPMRGQIVRPSTRVCTPQPQIDPQLYDMSTLQLKVSAPPSPAIKPAAMVVVTPQELGLLIKRAVDEALEQWTAKEQEAKRAQEGSAVGVSTELSEDALMDQLVDFDGHARAGSKDLDL